MDEHLTHHEQSSRAVGDFLFCCVPPVCAVGDSVLPESKKEQVKEPPEQTQQELVVKASQEVNFAKTVDVSPYAMLMEEALRCSAKTLPNQDLSKDPWWYRSHSTVFVSEDQGLMCIDIAGYCMDTLRPWSYANGHVNRQKLHQRLK